MKYIVKFTPGCDIVGTLTFTVDAKDDLEAVMLAEELLAQLNGSDCDVSVKAEQ